MKKIYYILSCLLLIFSFNSCYEPIAGSGIIVEKKINIRDFNSIEFDGLGTVHITQGASTSIKIKTDDNFLDDVELEKVVKKLLIKVSRKIAPTQLDIYITFEDISQLYLKGAGLIICNSTIRQKTDIWIMNSGDGNIVLNKLDAQNLYTILNSSGSIKIQNGNSDFISTNNDGYGTIDLIGLQSKRASTINSSLGATRINVSQYFKVTIKGKGNVWYKGNPKIDSTITGSGKLIKL